MEKRLIKKAVVAVSSLASLLILAGMSQATYTPAPSMTAQEEMVQFRQAGLHGDRSRIPAMIEAIQHSPYTDYVLTSLFALAQMGATEALPAIDVLIQDNKDPYVANFAKAARARLVAEDSARGIKDHQAQAAAKVNRFFQELGLTGADLNIGAVAYKEALRQLREGPVITMDADPPVAPVEQFAMRELADMAYQSPYRAFASLPGVAAVDFKLDTGSALKVRLASLAHDQRIAAMLQERTTVKDKSKMTTDEKVRSSVEEQAEAQLLADEGAVIIPKVKALQLEARARLERYKGSVSFEQRSAASLFTSLENVLEGAGDRQGVVTVSSTLANGKPTLEKRILRRQLMAGY